MKLARYFIILAALWGLTAQAQDSLNVRRLGQIAMVARGVAVAGNYAYVASASGGLRVINIANPASPTEAGFYNTPGQAYGVAVSGSYAYVADYDRGLRVINIANPASPTEVGFYDTPGIAYGVAVSGSYAYVADGNYFGIYDCSAAVSAPEPHAAAPVSFALAPAYPNPFNATTQISFDVPRSSFVQLRIYDLQGRVVENLVSRVFEAGAHSLTYDATGRASGMYLLRMTSGDFASAQKLILLK